MNKSKTHIIINNTIAFILFILLKIIFYLKKPKQNLNSILFINTGQIGDLMVTSLLLDNDAVFENYNNVVLLIKYEYLDLFKDYNGKIKILGYSYSKYKWNIIYRYKFLKYLHSLNFSVCYNLTAARGILNDEMALLSGAEKIFCLSSSWKYLTKLFGKITDSFYSEILFVGIVNEYDKHVSLLKLLDKKCNITYLNVKCFILKHEIINKLKLRNNRIITIAPLASDIQKSWGVLNYKKISDYLSNVGFKVLLLGSANERERIDSISNPDRGIINLSGRLSLNEVYTIIDNSILYIGNDSGLTHIAIKTKTRKIAIIGGGSFNVFFPINFDSNIEFLYDKMDCFGCEYICIHNYRKCLLDLNCDMVISQINKSLNLSSL